jgi:plasmid stability protein
MTSFEIIEINDLMSLRMSGNLHVRKLDDDLIARLKRRAAGHGRSTEAEHREILRQALASEVALGNSSSWRTWGAVNTLVIDASIAIKWMVEEDGTREALALREQAKLIAPELLVAECANILWKKCRGSSFQGTKRFSPLSCARGSASLCTQHHWLL